MKKAVYLVVLCLGILYACDPKPEGYDFKGRPYITQKKCVKSHTDSKYGYHYGYSVMKGKLCYHYGRYTETICDESKIDTTYLKVKTPKNVVN